MAPYEKWLTAVGPAASVPRAARKAMRSRLRAVAHYLKAAARPTGNVRHDVDTVHQLRVWTRRASAALAFFRDLLPRRTAKWLKRTLRQIRRTAGHARDCDVLAARLEKGEVPGLESAAVQLRAQRQWAERELASLAKSLLRSGRWERKSAKLLKKTRWKVAAGEPRPVFGPWCSRQLAKLLSEFAQNAAGDLNDDAILHETRIVGKRLRYALELASGSLPAVAHRRWYDELTNLQDRLGLVCDHIATVSRLKQWKQDASTAAARRQLRDAITREQGELASAKKSLFRWWTPSRRQKMLRRWEKALGKSTQRVLQ